MRETLTIRPRKGGKTAAQDRGHGTTTARLWKLRDGDYYVVGHPVQISYCRQLMQKHKIWTRVHFVVLGDGTERLLGVNPGSLIEVDHGVKIESESTLKLIIWHNQRARAHYGR